MTSRLISIILPVHNQADHIDRLVQEFVVELQKVPVPFELLLIENGSRDTSWEKCKEAADHLKDVHAFHSERPGWGRAVRLGLEKAEGDLICYTNSARTTAKDLVVCLLYSVAYDDTVVKANRKIRENWRRRIGSLLFNIECRTLFDLPYWDLNGTPKVFPRTFDQLLRLERDDDLIDVEFCIACRDNDYSMIEVPSFSSRRHGGKSTTGYRSAVRMYTRAIAFWRQRGSASRQKA